MFSTQGWTLGFLHYRQILYQLSHREALECPGWGSTWGTTNSSLAPSRSTLYLICFAFPIKSTSLIKAVNAKQPKSYTRLITNGNNLPPSLPTAELLSSEPTIPLAVYPGSGASLDVESCWLLWHLVNGDIGPSTGSTGHWLLSLMRAERTGLGKGRALYLLWITHFWGLIFFFLDLLSF